MQLVNFIELTHQDMDSSRIKLLMDVRELRQWNGPQHERDFLFYCMRNYENIWDEYQWMDLNLLKNEMQLSDEKILFLLKKLSIQGVISYYKNDSGLKVKMAQNRIPSAEFDRLENLYRRLKASQEKRVYGFLQLLTTKGCRNAFILHYFGEYDISQCSHCDRCQPSPFLFSIDENTIIRWTPTELRAQMEEAKKSRNSKLLIKIQKLHQEGLIQIPKDIFGERK